MDIEFFGHACLKIRGESGACLMDPWFARDGAFFRSWFQFPENHHLADVVMTDVRDVCVSHNHADHFDPWMLPRLLARPDTTLHIARFATPWFERRVRAALSEFDHDRIVVHPPFEKFETAAGGTVYFVPEESPGQIDSAIVWTDAKGRTLVNLNDARLTTDQLRDIEKRAGKIDVLTLQASGASEYPINYTWDTDEIRRRSVEKRALKIDVARRLIELLDPRRVLLFAGPPCFLDPELMKFGETSETSVFPDQLAVVESMVVSQPGLAGRIWFALPGEKLDDGLLWDRTERGTERMAPFEKKEEYVRDYVRRREGLTTFDPGEPPADDDLREHFEFLATRFPYMAESIGGAITFVVEGAISSSTWTVDFAAGEVHEGADEGALYVLCAPASSVAAVLAGTHTWDDIFLSLRMTFDERTDRFVTHFKTLLKYMDPGMDPLVRAYDARDADGDDAFMTVDVGGKTRRVQRHCPHAGADLEEHGVIDADAGTITCLAHRFCFALSTGQCLNAKGYSLRVE